MSEESRKIEEKLISFVKMRPALYDLRVSAKQRTKIIRENIWKDISNRLDGKLEPEVAEHRWKYLRENYIKSRRKEMIKDMISKRSGIKETKRKGKYSFRHYEIMQFLNEPLDYQKELTQRNAIKTRKSIETKLERNFKSNKSKLCEPEDCKEKEQEQQIEIDLDKDAEFEEVNSEKLTNPVNCFLQQNLSIDDNPKNRKHDFEEVFLQCLRKPMEKPCPIDGFLIRLGEGLRRLPYRERSKLELEFLTRLHEVEELLYDDNQ